MAIVCNLCPHSCNLEEGSRGICGIRQARNGRIENINHARPAATNIDPIEKKPLYHFWPSEKVASIGFLGCNLKCLNCQNFHLSQTFSLADFSEKIIHEKEMISWIRAQKLKMISYTYSEPLVSYEYVLKCSQLARESDLKNVLVSAGYFNQEPLTELFKVTDGANIDLKGFSDDFYKKVCKGTLAPVLSSMELALKMKVHLEISNLLISGLNDSESMIAEMCKWIKANLGADIPLHFLRFIPQHLMNDRPPTPLPKLEMAVSLARDLGLNHVYVGNAGIEENTVCPKCHKVVVERERYLVKEIHIKKGLCSFCGTKIVGVWR